MSGCAFISNNTLIITSCLRFNGRDLLSDTVYVISLLHSFLQVLRYYVLFRDKMSMHHVHVISALNVKRLKCHNSADGR